MCVVPQEAMQCVEELSAQNLLPVFVRVGVESTLERSQITRDHMGQLLHQLVQSAKLSKQDFFKGLVFCTENPRILFLSVSCKWMLCCGEMISHLVLVYCPLHTSFWKDLGVFIRNIIIVVSFKVFQMLK